MEDTIQDSERHRWWAVEVVSAQTACGQVRANGLIVFVPKFGIEGPVYLIPKDEAKGKEKQESDLVLDEDLQTIKSRKGDTSYTVREPLQIPFVIPSEQNRMIKE